MSHLWSEVSPLYGDQSLPEGLSVLLGWSRLENLMLVLDVCARAGQLDRESFQFVGLIAYCVCMCVFWERVLCVCSVCVFCVCVLCVCS